MFYLKSAFITVLLFLAHLLPAVQVASSSEEASSLSEVADLGISVEPTRVRANLLNSGLAPELSAVQATLPGETIQEDYYKTTFVSSSHFYVYIDGDFYSGAWTYVLVGPNTGKITKVYGAFGEEDAPGLYREETLFTFTSESAGTYIYREYNDGALAYENEGSFDFSFTWKTVTDIAPTEDEFMATLPTVNFSEATFFEPYYADNWIAEAFAFTSSSRFDLFYEDEVYAGDWSYELLSPNTGKITFFFDGWEPTAYSEELLLTFTDESSGGYVHIIFDNGEIGDYEYGTFILPFNWGAGELWHSGAVDLGDNWRWLDWFGSFNISSDPWILHAEHGWLYSYASGPNDIYFWDSEIGWFWTAKTVYPTLYRLSDSSWLYYVKGSKEPRMFVNVITGDWEYIGGPASTRIISLSGDLSFGSLELGQVATRNFTISNNGNSALTVNSIVYPSGFSGDWSSGTIAAGGSREVTVTFAPAMAQSYSGTVTVNSDSTGGTHTLLISGTGAGGGPAPGVMVHVQGGILSTSNNLDGTEVDTFEIGKYEVTWGEWQTVREEAAARGYDIDTAGEGCADDHPVHSVNWYDVLKWCNLKSEMEGLTPVYTFNGATFKQSQPSQSSISQNLSANGYRLPMSAEWEFAARGGNLTNGYRYSGSNELDSVGWYRDNSGGAVCDLFLTRGTWPVGQKLPNELGLHDMSGNISEWCWDRDGIDRRHRGGSWETTHYSELWFLGESGRPDLRYARVGFRLARTPSP